MRSLLVLLLVTTAFGLQDPVKPFVAGTGDTLTFTRYNENLDTLYNWFAYTNDSLDIKFIRFQDLEDGDTTLDSLRVIQFIVTDSANIDTLTVNKADITTLNATSGQVNGSDIVTLSASQTLTNKVMTSPDLNSPDIDGATFDGGTINSSSIGDSSASTGVFTTATSNTLIVTDSANIDTLVAGNADINGGSIDGTTIGASSASTGAFTTLSTSGNATLGNASGDAHTINGTIVANTNEFVLDGSGNVGIGTDSPQGDFHVLDDEATIRVQTSGSTAKDIRIELNHDNSENFTLRNDSELKQFEIEGATNGDLFVISFDGNVGIGTNSPANTLDVNGGIDASTLNTGQGDNELYAMNQDVETTDAVAFATVNTGQGDNELYAMNQDVETTDAVAFATVNTGQGANELYDMNQNVTTTSDVTFGNGSFDSVGTEVLRVGTQNASDVTDISGILYEIKTADESVSNSTTLQNDDHFVFATNAATGDSAYAVIDMAFRVSVGLVGDGIRFDFDDVGSNFTWIELDYLIVDGDSSSTGQITSFNQLVTYNNSTSTPGGVFWVHIRGTIAYHGSGTVAFRWAQATSSINSTTISRGAYMKVTRIKYR